MMNLVEMVTIFKLLVEMTTNNNQSSK